MSEDIEPMLLADKVETEAENKRSRAERAKRVRPWMHSSRSTARAARGEQP